MKIKRKHVLIFTAGLVLCLAALFGVTGRKVTASQSEDSVIQPAAVVLAKRKSLVNSRMVGRRRWREFTIRPPTSPPRIAYKYAIQRSHMRIRMPQRTFEAATALQIVHE
jgi:hypothetical protein